MKKHSMQFIFLLITLLLSACATMNSHNNSIKKISSDNWSMEGKVGIQSQEVNGSASLIWQQNKDSYNIRLFGPLGLGAVRLMGDDNQVKYVNQQGVIFTADSPEILLKQNLGWDMPISNLIYWVKGIPAPEFKAEKNYNMQHQLVQLKQQGWTIQYVRYFSDNLPQLIALDKRNIKIKLLINTWR
jgi:outer membrane lipoprotein LolB